MGNKKTLRTRLSTNRYLLRIIYYPWIVLPYPARRLVSIAGVWFLQYISRLRGTRRQQDLTPSEKLFDLSFWGVPHLDPSGYSLTIEGSVRSPFTLSLEDLKQFPAVERTIILDCVGGGRNVSVMRGVSFASLLERATPEAGVKTAIFRCADGYFTTHPVEDLLETDAFLAYQINGQDIPENGYPLRLVAPRKYGYKWAKWVTHIQLVPDAPKGYWEQRGLPDRAWVGDVR